MSINDLIAARRRELQLDDRRIAETIGISIDSYCDIESYPDEITSVVSLSQAKHLGAMLGLTPSELFGYDEATPIDQSQADLVALRKARGMSSSNLAKELGVEDWVVERIEADPAALGGWPFDFASSYAQALGCRVTALLALVPDPN